MRALASFLADVHGAKRHEPTLYERRVRELIGPGECVMGILEWMPAYEYAAALLILARRLLVTARDAAS